MRLIDPTKEVTIREATEYGYVDRTEHFDGSVDATVKVRSLRLNLVADAPPRKDYVAAIHELEQAQQEWIFAKNSPDPGWRNYASIRLRQANERLREVQG